MQNKVMARFHSATVRAVAVINFMEDISGKGSRAGIVVIRLDAGDGSARRPVAVNADKDRVGVGIGDGCADAERDEDVGIARHDDMVASPLQERPEALCHIKGQHLLVHAPHGMGSMVDAAMTGIDDHRAETGEIGPRLKQGASRQQQCRQQREQAESKNTNGKHGRLHGVIALGI